jgi:hypothetical protein
MTRFLRNLCTGAAAGFLCFCGAFAAEAQDVFFRPAMEAFVDKDTLLVFPAQIDTFQKVRVRKNENPVFGTVVRYENELGTCADVYIYSLDTGAKPVLRDMYEKHCRETEQDILKMPERNPKIASVAHAETPGRKAPGNGYEALFRIQFETTRLDSILYLALYEGKLVKVRISYSPEDIDESVQAYRFVDFVAAMMDRKKNTDAKKPEVQPRRETQDAGAVKSEPPETGAKS